MSKYTVYLVRTAVVEVEAETALEAEHLGKHAIWCGPVSWNDPDVADVQVRS